MANSIKAGIIGLIVGDALGVPVEFKSREEIAKQPIEDMIGYGTYNQPPGTWSDDSSLTLCLAEVLSDRYDLKRIGESFVNWLYHNQWTPHGEIFDVGISTREAIYRLKKGEKPELAGNWEEDSNGNGSLMRVLPLFYELRSMSDQKERYKMVKEVSSITHAHARSCLACFYYLEFASFIGHDHSYPLIKAYEVANHSFEKLTREIGMNPLEVDKFNRLLSGSIMNLRENEIRSTGYVIDTLEAAIWCLLTTTSYKDAVLKAVNLGLDTDTTGAVTGGLAGLFYGIDEIPRTWVDRLARIRDIEDLVDRLSDKYNSAK